MLLVSDNPNREKLNFYKLQMQSVFLSHVFPYSITHCCYCTHVLYNIVVIIALYALGFQSTFWENSSRLTSKFVDYSDKIPYLCEIADFFAENNAEISANRIYLLKSHVLLFASCNIQHFNYYIVSLKCITIWALNISI